MSSHALDAAGFCRTWRDSNAHVFTLERIEPDTERGGETLLLHGTSSNCQCGQRWYESHDGPTTLRCDSAHDLATGDLFGFKPEPSTLEDVQRFVGFLMGLTEEEWAHIRYVVEDDGEGEEYRDFETWVPGDVVGALYALARVPREGLTERGGDEGPPTRQAALVSSMLAAGHTDTEVIALALLLDLDPDGATALPLAPTEAERDQLVAQMSTLIALRATPTVGGH
jgi:hypothetical protein